MSPISRRTLAKGAAWTVPTLTIAAAAPAVAASTCPITEPVNRWIPEIVSPTYVGSSGFLGTAAFWVYVRENPVFSDGSCDPSGLAIENYSIPMTITVDVRRMEGSLTRSRTMTLGQTNPVWISHKKIIDVASQKPYEYGKVDYAWEVTFTPKDIMEEFVDQRFYVTIHSGDGGPDDRIKNSVYVDDELLTFTNGSHSGQTIF